MNKSQDLPESISHKISTFDSNGAACWEHGDIAEAERLFLLGWEQIPMPKNRWNDTMSSAIGIAEFYLRTRQYQKAIDWIPNLVLVNPTGIEAHVDLLIGRIHLESGHKTEAIKRFKKVYDSMGQVAFRGDNKRFLELVHGRKDASKKLAKPEASEWPIVPDPEAFKLMAGPLELDPELHGRIKALSAEGNALVEAERYDAAITKYREVLLLLPRPVEKWDASTWIYAAIGDALFLKGDFLAAAKPWCDVIYCPGARENGFIRLRRGQVALEQGNLSMAEKELTEAYRLGGGGLFGEEDPKYWAFIRPKLQT